VVIGVLVAVAVPRYAHTKAKAYVASMEADLKNLTTAQELFYNDSTKYYNGAVPDPLFPVSPSAGVTLTLQNVSATGWGATATHPGTPRACAIFIGTGGPVAPATIEGQVACDP
jgi:Tfp pilus assembly protein PilE